MKSKIIIIVVAAATLLSFTLVSVKKSKSQATQQTEQQGQKGFALQDNDQF
jgi:hypothetical protein